MQNCFQQFLYYYLYSEKQTTRLDLVSPSFIPYLVLMPVYVALNQVTQICDIDSTVCLLKYLLV